MVREREGGIERERERRGNKKKGESAGSIESHAHRPLAGLSSFSPRPQIRSGRALFWRSDDPVRPSSEKGTKRRENCGGKCYSYAGDDCFGSAC